MGKRVTRSTWSPRGVSLNLCLPLLSKTFANPVAYHFVVFSEHIAACGLAELPPTSLRAQYAERNYASRAHNWMSVLRPPQTSREMDIWRDIRDRIADSVLHVNSNADSGLVSVEADLLLIFERC
jgi:hypothetical protein